MERLEEPERHANLRFSYRISMAWVVMCAVLVVVFVVLRVFPLSIIAATLIGLFFWAKAQKLKREIAGALPP